MTEHTPGPWARNGYNLSEIIAIHDGPDGSGRSYKDGRHQHSIAICQGDNWESNSRLIAAAPELLEALVKCHDSYGVSSSPVWEMARNAIIKARGEDGSPPKKGTSHWSDCAMHNDPPGECDCGKSAPDYPPGEIYKQKIEGDRLLLISALEAIVNYESSPDFTRWAGVIEGAKNALSATKTL